MKYPLPAKKLPTSKGFTLVELMIVIAVVAILSVVGLTIISGVQGKARDAQRRGDIQAITKALEANKDALSDVYPTLAATNFASGKIPTDPDTAVSKYCYIATTPLPTPATWPVVSGCPAGWTAVDAGAPGASKTKWSVCARLETDTANPYCLSNQQ